MSRSDSSSYTPSRRGLLRSVALASSALAGARAAQAQDACAVFTPASQAATSPEAALARLKEGNARFVSGKTLQCDLMRQVKDTSGQQSPVAVVIGCIDSRVPPEMVFDQKLGDIFSPRIAGNFVNDDIVGSCEFATKLAGAKLIVVLGHSECGAVKGAVDDAKMGLLTGLLAQIRPSLAKLNYSGVPSSKDKALVQRVADQNAKDAAAKLTARSAILKELVDSGKLKIVSAMHDIGTGRVSWFA